MSNIMDLNEKVERLLYEKVLLEKKIKSNTEKLKPFIDEMRAFCKEKRLRRFTYGGFEMVYSPPKQYFKLLVKTKQVHEVHPEWVEEKTGYERLKITEIGE